MKWINFEGWSLSDLPQVCPVSPTSEWYDSRYGIILCSKSDQFSLREGYSPTFIIFSLNWVKWIQSQENYLLLVMFREVIKKKLGWNGQADRLGWPPLPPPPMNRSGKCEIFLLWFFTLVYDYIWPKTNFTKKIFFDHRKSVLGIKESYSIGKKS